jgi:hypothetical protein
MKRILGILFGLLLFVGVGYSQVVTEQSANRPGHYVVTHSDTVTADSTQYFQFYAKVSKAAELVQGLDLTKSGTNVNCTIIRQFSLGGDTWTNLDTLTVANTTVSAQAAFSVVDFDYPYYKITVDGASNAGIFPLKLYTIIKEK